VETVWREGNIVFQRQQHLPARPAHILPEWKAEKYSICLAAIATAAPLTVATAAHSVIHREDPSCGVLLRWEQFSPCFDLIEEPWMLHCSVYNHKSIHKDDARRYA
jgi:hypothetical protein